MNSDILNYLEQKFYSLQQLVDRSGVAEARINDWIAAGCLPAHSYRVDAAGNVHSFFGVHESVTDGSEETLYFNPSHIGRIEELEKAGQPSQELAKTLRQAFCSDYLATLTEHRMDRFGMADCFNADGSNSTVLNELLESEWGGYLDGTYGLCTRNADAEEIATKEAMIKKIKYLTGDGSKEVVTGVERQELSEAIDRLDRVSSQFAPHEFERSSRYKYVVVMREKYRLSAG